MLESLDTPTWNDRVVRDLVLSEGQKYLRGEAVTGRYAFRHYEESAVV